MQKLISFFTLAFSVATFIVAWQILVWCYEPIDIPIEEETFSWEKSEKSC